MLETTESYAWKLCDQTKTSNFLNATSHQPVLDTWAFSDFVHSQRLQGSRETEAWSPTAFLKSTQNSFADARDSKSKATGHGQAGSSRASVARRSYQCITSRLAEKNGDLRLNSSK